MQNVAIHTIPSMTAIAYQLGNNRLLIRHRHMREPAFEMQWFDGTDWKTIEPAPSPVLIGEHIAKTIGALNVR